MDKVFSTKPYHVAFMLQTCVEKFTPLCVFTFNIKFFKIIITDNMWIKVQIGDGMATFWNENKINSRINVACFYFWSLVCQILILWGMDHVGTWFCKRCVWNLTYWVQFRSCQDCAKNGMKVLHVKLCGDDCLISTNVITWMQWLGLCMKC
jgi:hypothetical protein